MGLRRAEQRVTGGRQAVLLVRFAVYGPPFPGRMRAGFGRAAAGADIIAVFVRRGRVVVLAAPFAVHTRPAITRAAVALLAASADVPAAGESISDGEHVAAAAGEVVVREALAGIERGAVAQRIHPAGGVGEVKFPEGAVRIVQTDAVPVEAAPKDGEIAVCAEPGVDPGEDLIGGAAELVPFLIRLVALAECAGAAHKVGAVVQLSQIEALIQSMLVCPGPAGEGRARLVERRGHILIEDDLGDHIGERLGGENVVGDRAVLPEAEDAQVDINLRRLAGLLARLAALGREIQAFFRRSCRARPRRRCRAHNRSRRRLHASG